MPNRRRQKAWRIGSVAVLSTPLRRPDDRFTNANHSRYPVRHISGAKFVKREGSDHPAFLTAICPANEYDRTLAAVLFADIVDSTEKAVQIGDASWRDLLAEFQRRSGRTLERFRGRMVDTAGDGIFAVFDGAARAVRCALALCTEADAIGLQTRAGVHIGEVERMGQKFCGVAVHVGARIMGLAAGGDVLVSSTVKDIVAGSGLQFDDHGAHALKGVQDEWRLFLAREG